MSLFGLWCINYAKQCNRDARYTLEGMIEFDQGYFTVESSQVEKSKAKRGRGAAGKQNVAIGEESIPLEDILEKNSLISW